MCNDCIHELEGTISNSRNYKIRFLYIEIAEFEIHLQHMLESNYIVTYGFCLFYYYLNLILS